MPNDLSAAELAKLRETIAKQEITAVVYRLARGLDRCDKAILQSCFHEGATDDHGMFKGTAADFCDWVMGALDQFGRTMHFIGNLNITVTGDTAASEAYFIAHHVMDAPGADGADAPHKMDMIAAGRYLDRFENRGGVWAITHRHAVYDWNRADASTDTWSDPAIAAILERGVRGQSDPSYAHLKNTQPQ